MFRKLSHVVPGLAILAAALGFANLEIIAPDIGSSALPPWFVGSVKVNSPPGAPDLFGIVLYVEKRYGDFFKGQIWYNHDEELNLVKHASGELAFGGTHIGEFWDYPKYCLCEKDEVPPGSMLELPLGSSLHVRGRRFFWRFGMATGKKDWEEVMNMAISRGHTILADFFLDDGDVYRGRWEVRAVYGQERESPQDANQERKSVQYGLGQLLLVNRHNKPNQAVPAALKFTDTQASRFRAILWVPTYDPLLAQLSGTRDKSGRIKWHVERLTRPDKRTSQQLPIVRGSVLEADIRGQFITGNVLLSESDKNRLAGVSFEFGLVNWEW